MLKNIIVFFDKLEDKVRALLSTKPIIYSSIAAVGIVLLWRGIWLTADSLSINGLWSIFIGVVILLMIGVFVSAFIGNRILLTGLRNEKKLAEKTKEEIEIDLKSEGRTLKDINLMLKNIEHEMESLGCDSSDHIIRK